MTTDLSILSLITNASVLVQLVMLVLLITSLLSWNVIFQKRKMLAKARADADEFEEKFWSGGDLSSLYNQVTSGRHGNAGLTIIFEAGFKEFARLRKQEGIDPMAVLEGAQRSMRVALSREIDKLEEHLPFLATVGSTSPYIGLFGTVWGIMNSFRALGNVKQATISMVAPGIAEALVATAMGLFAAIPAVIGFNRYNTELERLINRYDAFLEEFSSILQRQAHK
ncbi:MAG: protein TolQ [Ectothiorhodospiraceae bacterium]|nr:protein TolQ [Ectothiorhodospiraceae bacterium]